MNTTINNECDSNTVYKKCTVNTRITEIRLLFASPKLSNKTLVLVEGITDKIYQYLLNKETVYIKQNGSCDGIINIVATLNQEYKESVIVIKDADFDNLNHITYAEYDNVFLTDSHDIETMMLSSESMERKLAMEFMAGDESGFVKKCISDLEILSYTKWYNITNHLSLITKGVKIGNIYQGEKGISLETCEAELYKIEQNKERCPCLAKEVQKFMDTHRTEDKWNLVNGHDLCNALSIYFNKKGKSCGNVSQCIRMGYTMQDFKKTQLYERLINWEKVHGKTILNSNCI